MAAASLAGMYEFGWVQAIVGLMTSYNVITRTGVQTGAVANWCHSRAWIFVNNNEHTQESTDKCPTQVGQYLSKPDI